MKQKVVFHVIDDVITGVNKKGLTYKVQSVLVSWEEPADDPSFERNNWLKAKIFNEDVDRLAALCPVPHMTEAVVDIRFDVKDVNGRLSNDIRLWLNE